jgi:hypothetical protein
MYADLRKLRSLTSDTLLPDRGGPGTHASSTFSWPDGSRQRGSSS